VSASHEDVEKKVFFELASLIGADLKPLAVAFSGGGDSTALLSLVLKWSKKRHVHALIIDHGLRKGSAKEAKLAKSRAKTLGATAHILKCQWPSGVPTTGIQEKARNARYQMLGDTCRSLGVKNLLLGHNQDDQAETVLMRQNSGSGWRGLAGIKSKSRAPIWPALNGLNIVRPTLPCGRNELRTYNKNNDLQWIDDPSNNNKTFARIRAREHLSEHPNERKSLLAISRSAWVTLDQEQAELSGFIKAHSKFYEWGGLALLPEFRASQRGQMAEALRYLLPAISGEALPPSYDKRLNLVRRLFVPNFSGATLGGVRFVARKDDILCVRDLGSLLGRTDVQALEPMRLKPSKTSIWDGRFSVTSLQDGVYVDTLANWTQKLTNSQKTLLKSLPEPARGGIPVFIKNNQIVHIPFVDFTLGKHDFQTRSLPHERLAALLGDFYR
jgi:tRNA(Ile)-lysidine synthase